MKAIESAKRVTRPASGKGVQGADPRPEGSHEPLRETAYRETQMGLRRIVSTGSTGMMPPGPLSPLKVLIVAEKRSAR